MVVNTTLFKVAKYGFYGLTITCAGVLIATMTIIKHVKAPDDLSYNDLPSLPYQNSGDIFDRQISHCLTVPTNPFCLKDPDQRKRFIRLRETSNDAEEASSNQTASSLPTTSTKKLFGDFLRDFCSLMLSLGVRSFLIEPSMLFCMMTPVAKLRLLKDGFVPARTLKKRNVVTFGVMSEDAMTLDEDSAVGKALSAGFEVSRSRRWKGPWLENSSLHTTHYFFIRRNFMVHLVTFFESGNFLWHAELTAEEGRNLLYNKESLYEKFNLQPYGDEILPGLRIPLDPQFFLLQIESSRVVQPLRLELEEEPLELEENAKQSLHMSDEQMRIRAFVAFEDLKNRLRPEGISFWMQSRTLLGWYLHGDIFSISHRLQVAANFRTLNDSAIRNLFFDNDYLKMKLRFSCSEQDFGYEFDCDGLIVSFLIAREDENGSWSVITETGKHSNKTVYPKFDLCSTDVVGQKIHVPCKPEEIFKAEFGERWRKMSSFNNNLN